MTGYIDTQPGGFKKVLLLCGTDGTAAFTAQHGGKKRSEAALEGHKIGVLTR